MNEEKHEVSETKKSYYGGLSSSTRITLAGIAAVVMLGFTFWVIVTYGSGKPVERECLFEGKEFNARDIMGVEAAFAREGLREYKIMEGRVEVPFSDRDQYILALEKHGVISSSSSAEKSRGIMGVPRTGDERKQDWVQRKQQEIARKIEDFRGIEKADVILDVQETSVGITRKETATASVTIRSAPNIHLSDMDMQAIHALVVHAVSILKPEDVIIVDSRENRLWRWTSSSRTGLQEMAFRAEENDSAMGYSYQNIHLTDTRTSSRREKEIPSFFETSHEATVYLIQQDRTADLQKNNFVNEISEQKLAGETNGVKKETSELSALKEGKPEPEILKVGLGVLIFAFTGFFAALLGKRFSQKKPRKPEKSLKENIKNTPEKKEKSEKEKREMESSLEMSEMVKEDVEKEAEHLLLDKAEGKTGASVMEEKADSSVPEKTDVPESVISGKDEICTVAENTSDKKCDSEVKSAEKIITKEPQSFISVYGAQEKSENGKESSEFTADRVMEDVSETLFSQEQKTGVTGEEKSERSHLKKKDLLRENVWNDERRPVIYSRSLDDLKNAPAQYVAEALRFERPQVTAQVMLHVGKTQASAILACFPSEKQEEIMTRFMECREINREILEDVLDSVAARVYALMPSEIFTEKRPAREMKNSEESGDQKENSDGGTDGLLVSGEYVFDQVYEKGETFWEEKESVTEKSKEIFQSVYENKTEEVSAEVSDGKPNSSSFSLEESYGERLSEGEDKNKLSFLPPGVSQNLTFDDFIRFSDDSLRDILKSADPEEAMLSFVSASSELQERFLCVMKPQYAEQIRLCMKSLGPMRLSDLEESRRRMVLLVGRLVAERKIKIPEEFLLS
ncbi:MAG: FliG C-terminal domain-containing protein [Planctomycetia bacterium]|nr:FliG C-terminal domain-containing protein [Planctomycetia bacterium]